MVSFEKAVNNLLCGIQDELKKIRQINETWEKRETTDIAFFTIPENGGVRSFAIGTTKINFKTGVIVNPDSTKEYMNRKLDQIAQEWLHSISVDSNMDIKLKILPNSIRSVDAYFSTQIPYLNYNEIEITCTAETNIKIFACTNPSAVVGQYKNPMTDVDGRMVVSSISQLNVEKDVAEAQTWDTTLTSLLSNLNRIRKKLNDIIGGTSWTDTVSASLGTIWAKFNATTGHKHSGAADDAGQIDHVNLASKGTNTHAQIDTFIASGGGASSFFRQFLQKQGTVVQGAWAWSIDASQTNFISLTSEAAGYYTNSSVANLDEYKWGDIFLSAGNYKITISSLTYSNRGIMEVLFGSTSLGTSDLYSAGLAYNIVKTYTFTLTTAQTADLRFRVNGKNVASSGYLMQFSRIELEKTA